MDGNRIRGAFRAACKPTLALVLVLTVLAGPAAAASLPPQGLYDQCSPAASGDACASRLAAMGQAGFKVVLNYTSWDATPDQLRAFANAASANGMQVIWPLNNTVWRHDGDISRTYPTLAAACGCTMAHDLLAYVAGIVGSTGATWGWYVGDELPATELPAVLALVARIKALDPVHPTLYIAYEHSGTAGANLLPFATAADTVGAAIYPYGAGPGVDSLAQMQIVSGLVNRLVGSARRQAMVLQAFDWAAHPDETSMPGGYPDETFMRAARDAALAGADPSLLLWYSYNDIQRSADPAGHWHDLVTAAFGPDASASGAVGTAADTSTATTVAATKKTTAKKAKKKAKKKKIKKKAPTRKRTGA